MSHTQHTPGPWVARLIEPQEWEIDAPNGDPTIGHKVWSGLAVVYGSEEHKIQGRCVSEANAHLIAAAPKLYEALLECLECEFAVTDKAAIEKARAALAKARGEA